MTITNSQILDDAPQRDGRRFIREAHADSLGIVHTRMFLAPADYDAAAGLAANADVIDQELTAQELAANEAEVAGG